MDNMQIATLKTAIQIVSAAFRKPSAHLAPQLKRILKFIVPTG